MSERVSIKREAEVACEIHDLTYRGKQVPAGHARALAALLNARGLLAPESSDLVRCPKCGGPDPFHDPACVVHPDLIQDHNEQEQR